MKKSLVIGAIASLLAFSANTSQAGNKSLVVYYSQSSTTEKVANIIQKKTGADIERIKLVNDYSGDMGAIAGAFMKERQENKFRDMQKMKANVADYDTLYVGYPVWAGTISGGMQSFLKSTEIKGKVIIPFCTFGSGGNTSITDLREALPGNEILSWYGVRQARVDKAEAEVESFLVDLGVLKGNKKVLPSFSAQRALTSDDKAVFDKACGSYPMPLGTPESVSTRSIDNGTEYLFITSSKDMQGNESQQKIYVTNAGGVTEFTQVER